MEDVTDLLTTVCEKCHKRIIGRDLYSHPCFSEETIFVSPDFFEELQTNNLVEGPEQQAQPQHGETSSGNSREWNSNEVLQLIECWHDHRNLFNTGVRNAKSAWQKLKTVLDGFGFKHSAEEYAAKWKSLKRTYKRIVDNNKSSGRGHQSWPYFDAMDSALGDRPEVRPVSKANEIQGLTIGDNENEIEEISPPDTASRDQPGPSGTAVRRKRKPDWLEDLLESQQKRHEDLMLAQQKRQEERMLAQQKRHEEAIKSTDKLCSVLEQFLNK